MNNQIGGIPYSFRNSQGQIVYTNYVTAQGLLESFKSHPKQKWNIAIGNEKLVQLFGNEIMDFFKKVHGLTNIANILARYTFFRA